MKKRLFAGALALLMIIGLLPVSSMLKKPIEAKAAVNTYSYTCSSKDTIEDNGNFGTKNFFKLNQSYTTATLDNNTLAIKMQKNDSGYANNISFSFVEGSADIKVKWGAASDKNQKLSLYNLNGESITGTGTENAAKKVVYTAEFKNLSAGTYYLAGGTKYIAISEIEVTVTTPDSGETEEGYKVTVIDPANTYSTSNVFTVAEGNTIDYTASDKDNFDYWENSHGVKVSTDPSLKDFPVYYSDTYTAVYKKTGAKVVYYTPYGGVYRTYYKNDVFTEAPEVPTLYGYAPGNWDKDYTTVKDLLNNATDSSEISIKPEYPTNDSSMKYEINIDATKFGKESVEKLSKVVNELVTASIDANKEKFAYWKDDKGNIVSYNPTYYFLANRDVTVTAVSTEEATDTEKKGVITQIKHDETSRTVIFEYTVPDDFTMNYVGVLGSTNESILTNAVVNVDAKGVYQLGNSNCSGYKTFRYTLNIVGSETWYVKPVLIYSNADGVQQNPVYGNKITIK